MQPRRDEDEVVTISPKPSRREGKTSGVWQEDALAGGEDTAKGSAEAKPTLPDGRGTGPPPF